LVYIEELIMPKLAMYVPLKARPGKESDVADFLTSALALVQAEPGTLTAYSMMPDKR
jgi:quinol monooxygenase YgiN